MSESISMTLNEYAHLAMRSAATPPTDDPMLLAIGALGLTGEAGEVADLVKKYLGHNHPLNTSKILEKLGDVMWYVARMAQLLHTPLETIAAMNIAKLRARYSVQDGFSTEALLHRDAEAEKNAMAEICTEALPKDAHEDMALSRLVQGATIDEVKAAVRRFCPEITDEELAVLETPHRETTFEEIQTDLRSLPAPGMTDLMVDPESLDKYLDKELGGIE